MSNLGAPLPPVLITRGKPLERSQHASHSSLDLPTPPDEPALADLAKPHAYGSFLVSPSMVPRPVSSDVVGIKPLHYAGFRPLGVSSFQLSAERASHEQGVEDDDDMSVDDVFSYTSKRDRDDVLSKSQNGSPTLGPSSHDPSENVPFLQASTGSLPSSGSLTSSVPAASRQLSSGSSTPSSRYASFRYGRSLPDPAGDNGGLSTRRMPYNVPGRTSGSLGQVYAVGMAPYAPLAWPSGARRPSWTHTRPSTIRPGGGMYADQQSFSHVGSMDDEETDEEMVPPDDDATDDEGEQRHHPHVDMPWRPPTFQREYNTSTSFPRQHGMHAPMPHRGSLDGMASSLPVRIERGDRTYPLPRTYDATPARCQGAAMDTEDGALAPRAVGENDQVAAIRDRLGGAANCSAFISKLWHLMINPEVYGKYIQWNHTGDIIVISSAPDIAAEFASDVLPKLFKHGNNASFVRQLNLYGFQRVSASRMLDLTESQLIAAKRVQDPRAEVQALSCDPPAVDTAAELYGLHASFSHPHFRRGHEAWLASMKPRSTKKPKHLREPST